MSGIKDVQRTISQAEYNRLMRSAARAAESDRLAQQRQAEAEAAKQKAREQLALQNSAFNREIVGLRSEYQEQVNRQNERFRRQATENQRKLDEQATTFNRSVAEVRSELRTSINEVRQEAQEIRNELRTEINEVNSRVGILEARHETEREIIIERIEATQAIFNDIAQFRHDLFARGRLEELKDKLDKERPNLDRGIFNADVFRIAKETFNEAFLLREEIGNAENEWTLVQAAFQDTLTNVQSNLNSNRDLHLDITLEEGVINQHVDVNYWAGNTLNNVGEKIDDIVQRTTDIRQVSTDDLRGFIDTLADLDQEMSDAAERAKEELMLSQHRAAKANQIIEIFESCGWRIRDEEKDGWRYENDEYNMPIIIKLQDGLGNEVAIEIGLGDNCPHTIHYFPNDNDEENVKPWTASLENMLAEGGVGNEGKPVCRSGYENRHSDRFELRDIRNIAPRVASQG